MLSIKQNAIFIADAHYPHHGDAFFVLLEHIERGRIKTPQLFLLGDNFDLLFGYNHYIQTFSHKAITLLQRLSHSLEIHYFEGNHDFCLKDIFTNIKVYTREQQPILFTLKEKKVALAHGDKYATGFGYNLYCSALRNKTSLKLLKPLQKPIIDHVVKRLAQKDICHTFKGFEKRVECILKYYEDVDLVIEGHFHQSRIIGKYISLPSLACQGQVGVAKEGTIVFQHL